MQLLHKSQHIPGHACLVLRLSKDTCSCLSLSKSQMCGFAIFKLPNELTATALKRVFSQKKSTCRCLTVMSSTECTRRSIWDYEPLCSFCDLRLQRHVFLKIEAEGKITSEVKTVYLKHIRIHGNNIFLKFRCCPTLKEVQ